MENPIEKKAVERIVEKVPERLVTSIVETIAKTTKLNQVFSAVSDQLAIIQKRFTESYDNKINSQKRIGNVIHKAYNKMKLGKRKNISWIYSIKEKAFIGTLKPEPKKIEEKK